MDPLPFLDAFRYTGAKSRATPDAVRRVRPPPAPEERQLSTFSPDLNADSVTHILAMTHTRPDRWKARKAVCNWNVALAMYAVSRAWRNGLFNAIRQVYGFEARQAHAFLDVLVGRHNVFLTGPAGSGKSYVIDCLREAIAQLEGKGNWDRLAILAPTGIAAINVGGRTICSFCGMRPRVVDAIALGFWPEAWPEAPQANEGADGTVEDVPPPARDDESEEVEESEETPVERGTSLMVPMRSNAVKQRCARLHRIFVDEVSMADELLMRQLELVVGDAIGRKHPFVRSESGRRVQLVLVGDFAQLPPVYEHGSLKEKALCDGTLQKYLFQSPLWKELRLHEHALTVVKRTDNAQYLQVLSELRDGEQLVGERLDRLRAITRVPGRDDVEEDLALFGRHWPDRAITDDAQRARYPCVVNWNKRKMAELPTPPLDFLASAKPDPEDPRGWTPPVPPNVVTLKEGCTIMVTRNMWALSPGARSGDEEEEGSDEEEGGSDEEGGTRRVLTGHRVANGSIGTFVGTENSGERLLLRFPKPKGPEGATFTVAISQTEYHASRVRQRGECNRSCPARRATDAATSTSTRTTGTAHMQGCPRRYFRASKRQFSVTPSSGITIHKSQGQTLRQRFVVRIDQSWDAGQLYVALSRASHPRLMRLAGPSKDAKRSTTMRKDVAAVKAFHARIPAPPAYVA